MDYSKLWWLQWQKAVFQPVICRPLFLDGLFYSFGDETILDDDYVQNNDVGKLNNETDHDSGIICYWYPNASDDKNYWIKPEQEQCTKLSV